MKRHLVWLRSRCVWQGPAVCALLAAEERGATKCWCIMVMFCTVGVFAAALGKRGMASE